MIERIPTRVSLLLAAIVLLGHPAIAMAATVPPVSLNKGPAIWVGYLVMALLLGLVLVVSLMPSKRGHQD